MDTDKIIEEYIKENQDMILKEEMSVLKKFPALIGNLIEFGINYYNTKKEIKVNTIITKKIFFKENGDEYIGMLEIKCETFNQINNRNILVNDALITLDEDIIEIKELKLK